MMEDKVKQLAETLYQEGVQKGLEQKSKLLAEATEQASQIVQQAEADRSRILEQANLEAEALKKKVQNELQQTTRQAIAELKEQLSQLILSDILKEPVKRELRNPDVIKTLMIQAIQQMKPSESQQLEVFVPAELEDQWVQDLKNELLQWLKEEPTVSAHQAIHLGFEIKRIQDDFLISFTNESFESWLSNYLSPSLKALWKY